VGIDNVVGNLPELLEILEHTSKAVGHSSNNTNGYQLILVATCRNSWGRCEV
jgi:hypothetical protein